MADASYEAHRLRVGLRSRQRSHDARDIGSLPPVADVARKQAALADFRHFCDSYLRARFWLPWSEDHLTVIRLIEQTVIDGGQFAIAMPRGFGKTSLCEAAVLWSLLLGHHRFVMLIAATEDQAQRMLSSIKQTLASNDLLLADFPEVCFPIRKLEGETRRALGQHINGRRTAIVWGSTEIVLPDVLGSRAAGSTVRVAGLTGNIRGAAHTLPTGEVIRPSLLILDDPQTDVSAKSMIQTQQRIDIINGAALGLAGPGRRISALMPCTVIQQGDLADQMLDTESHPEWHGYRTKLIYEFPKRSDLWEQYAELLRSGLRAGRGFADATKFYVEHRQEMDEGARVAWPDRFDDGEVSAVQHAMNLRLRDERTFAAEYQNAPMLDESHGASLLRASELSKRVGHTPRNVAPLAAEHVTGFVDVQQGVLYWMLVAWSRAFGGTIIDYGTSPPQARAVFRLRDITTRLPGATAEEQIDGGLRQLVAELAGRKVVREDGIELSVERLLVDGNWQTDAVYRALRGSGVSIALVAHGRAVTAADRPMSEWPRTEGERVGLNWRLRPASQQRRVRHVIYDGNFWKSRVAQQLRCPIVSSSAIVAYRGRDHEMLADHFCAEQPVETMGRGRRVEQWRLLPGAPDNHYWDCLIGCAVGASMVGCEMISVGQPSRCERSREGIAAPPRVRLL